MENDNMEFQINTMLSCKIILESCNSNLKEYNDIYNSIKNFLLNFCEHDIVEDHIDISDEYTKLIKYCKKCETTFTPSNN